MISSGAIAPKQPLSPLARQIGAFIFAGATGFCVDMSVTLLLTQNFDVSPYWAKLPAILCALCVTFLLNRRFTFNGRAGEGMAEFRRYCLACATAQSTNYVVFSLTLFTLERLIAQWALTGLPETAPIFVAAVAGAGLSAGVTFFMAKFYAFRAS